MSHRKHPEKILGIKRDLLESIFGVHHGTPMEGFFKIGTNAPPIHHILNKCEWRVRDEVEDDPSFQQIIPYVIIRRFVGDFIIVYERGKHEGEARLHAKLSLGIGGHIEESDTGLGQPNIPPFDPNVNYQVGFVREILEETTIDSMELGRIMRERLCPPIGYIKTDSDDVGKVHLGVVHVLTPPSPIRLRETDRFAWNDPNTVHELYHRFEKWSQVVIDNLDSIISGSIGPKN